MNRVKLIFPNVEHFKCNLPILVQHINYGNHVGNDSIVSLLHHSRVCFFQNLGYTELAVEGVGLIMADLQVQYKHQIYLHQNITIAIAINEISNNGFTICYKITINEFNNTVAALAQSNMLFFNYETQKIANTPLNFANKFAV